jgi:hypothetical protein
LVVTGNAIVSLGAGNYTIEATAGDSESRDNITIKAKATTNDSLTLTKSLSPAYTINYSASNLSLSGSDVKFLNTALQQIYEKDSVQKIEQSIVPNLYPITQLSWVNHQQAYVVVNTLNIYYINGNSDSLVAWPATSPEDQTVMDLDTNSSGDLVYARAGVIYRELHNGAGISKIGTYDPSSPQTEVVTRIAPDGTVFVSSFVGNENSPPTNGHAYFVNPAGSQVKYSGKEIVIQASWAPDSKNLAMSTYSNFGIYKYPTGQIITVSNHSINPVGSFNWVITNRLLYVDQGIIWMYQPGHTYSTKLAVVPGTIYHTVPFFSSDPNTIYFSTDPQDASGTGASIYRLNF